MEKNAKQKVLEGIWKKAMREGKVELLLKDRKEVHRLRMALYNAVLRCKKGKEEDTDLVIAASHCVVQTKDLLVTVMKSDKMEDVVNWAELAGIEIDGESQMDKELSEHAMALAQKLGGLVKREG